MTYLLLDGDFFCHLILFFCLLGLISRLGLVFYSGLILGLRIVWDVLVIFLQLYVFSGVMDL